MRYLDKYRFCRKFLMAVDAGRCIGSILQVVVQPVLDELLMVPKCFVLNVEIASALPLPPLPLYEYIYPLETNSDCHTSLNPVALGAASTAEAAKLAANKAGEKRMTLSREE
jgi:hypothetical protein